MVKKKRRTRKNLRSAKKGNGGSKTRHASPKRPKKIKKKQPRKKAARKTSAVSASMGFENLVSRVAETQKTPPPIGAHLDRITTEDKTAKNTAILLTIDPRFAFTYWEVQPEAVIEAARKLGPDAKLTLRFYDISSTNDPETSANWDVEVFDRRGNWYLKLEHPDQRLCVDICVKNSTGEVAHLARSAIRRLPLQALVQPAPLKWIEATPDTKGSQGTCEEYTNVSVDLLKKILGPYFYDLFTCGKLGSIEGSSTEALFHDVRALRLGQQVP